jgi:purine-binding chemotaxis protein CheW
MLPNGYWTNWKLINKEATMSTQKSNNNRQQPTDQLNSFEINFEETLSSTELAEIWARRAYELAQKPPSSATGQTADLLVFWLGKERYGIEVTNVREIHPLEQLTPVPRTPNFVAGVFSARGRILSVVDLCAFFDLPAIGLSDQTKIIVVSNAKQRSVRGRQMVEVGILADEVADVVTIFKKDIQPPLTTHTGVRADYIQGITADLLVVLNLDILLNDKRLIVQEELL